MPSSVGPELLLATQRTGYLPRAFKDGHRSRHVEDGFTFDAQSGIHESLPDTVARARIVHGERKELAILACPASDVDGICEILPAWINSGRAERSGRTAPRGAQHCVDHLPTLSGRQHKLWTSQQKRRFLSGAYRSK